MSQKNLFGENVKHASLPYCPVDFRASRSALPGSNEAKMMTVSSGLKCLEWCQSCGPLGCLEKMLVGSSLWHSTRCSLTWKVLNTKQGRSFFRLVPLMPGTGETDVSLWPTPAYSQMGKPVRPLAPSEKKGNHGIMLVAAVYDAGQKNPICTFPTPTRFDATCGNLKGKEYTGKNRHAMKLIQAAKMYPTPTTNDAKNATLPPSQADRDSIPGRLIQEGCSGKLNPQWVEWLMGFPPGWTDLDA